MYQEIVPSFRSRQPSGLYRVIFRPRMFTIFCKRTIAGLWNRSWQQQYKKKPGLVDKGVSYRRRGGVKCDYLFCDHLLGYLLSSLNEGRGEGCDILLKYNVQAFRKAVAFQGYMPFPAIEHVMTVMQYVWQNESVLFCHRYNWTMVSFPNKNKEGMLHVSNTSRFIHNEILSLFNFILKENLRQVMAKTN